MKITEEFIVERTIKATMAIKLTVYRRQCHEDKRITPRAEYQKKMPRSFFVELKKERGIRDEKCGEVSSVRF